MTLTWCWSYYNWSLLMNFWWFRMIWVMRSWVLLSVGPPHAIFDVKKTPQFGHRENWWRTFWGPRNASWRYTYFGLGSLLCVGLCIFWLRTVRNICSLPLHCQGTSIKETHAPKNMCRIAYLIFVHKVHTLCQPTNLNSLKYGYRLFKRGEPNDN